MPFDPKMLPVEQKLADAIERDDALSLVEGGGAVPVKPPRLKIKAQKPRALKVTKEMKTKVASIIKDSMAKGGAERQQLIERVKAKDVTPEAIDEAMQAFEKAVGGRDRLIEVLKHCPHNSIGAASIAKLTGDASAFDEIPLKVLAEKHGISLPILVGAFKDGTQSKLAIEALLSAAKSTKVVVEQLAEDSQSRWVPCTMCEGEGRVDKLGENGEFQVDQFGVRSTHICYDCRGKGRVWQKHDFSNRKTFLELTKLIDKKPLVETTITTNNNSLSNNLNYTPGDGGFERLMRAVDVALTSKHSQIKHIEEANESIEVPFSVYEDPVESKEEDQ